MWVWKVMTKITLDHLCSDLWELIMFDSRREYDFGELFENVSKLCFFHNYELQKSKGHQDVLSFWDGIFGNLDFVWKKFIGM